MIFSDQLLFLHVPKAGGSTIGQFLLDVLPEPVLCTLPVDHVADLPSRATRITGIAHEGLAEARLLLQSRGRRLEDVPLIIACIRNPYELEVSRYAFLRQDLNSYNHSAQQALALLGDFELFAVVSRPHGGRPLESYFTLDGEVPKNLRLIRLERLDDDLRAALSEIGIDRPPSQLPFRNRSDHDEICHYYTPAAEQAVYEKYKWVFEAGLYPRLNVGRKGSAAQSAASASFLRQVEMARTKEDDFWRAYRCLATAEVNRHLLMPRAQQDALEGALRHAAGVGSQRLLARTAQELSRCWSLSGFGTVEAGIAGCQRLLESPLGPIGVGAPSFALAELLAAAGRSSEARAVLSRVGSEVPELSMGVAAAATSVEYLAGRQRQAERWSRSARPWNTTEFVAARPEVLCQLGQYREAEPLIDFAQRTTPASDICGQVRWRRSRAKLLLYQGERQQAVNLCRAAVQLMESSGGPNVHADALVDLANALNAAGRADEAHQKLGEATTLYARTGNVCSTRTASERTTTALP